MNVSIYGLLKLSQITISLRYQEELGEVVVRVRVQIEDYIISIDVYFPFYKVTVKHRCSV